MSIPTNRRGPTRRALFAAVAGALPLPAAAQPALRPTLPRCTPSAIGVARTLTVDTARGLKVGRFQFPTTLPLARGEVVLTFDDGPLPATTPRVLSTLAEHCTRATFFMIGRNAAANPATARAVAQAGHTVGHHSMIHPAPMTEIPPARAIADIEAGMAAIRGALGRTHAAAFAPGFFRYPGLWNPPAVDAWLETNRIGVFGIDVHARDWELTSAEAVVDLAMHRLRQQGRGILLLHDNQPVTAVALPILLASLKDGGWRVVHIAPQSI